MTKAAKHFGKRIQHFFDNDGTGEYAVALHRALSGIDRDSGDWSVMDYLDAHTFLVQAKRGGKPGDAGTWCHPKLAVFFARWLDVRFAVWCDLMIDNILHGHIQTTVAVPTEEALAVDSVVASLRARVESLQENVKRLQEEGFKGGVPDGYINITKAAKHFGKKLSNFWRSPETGEYLMALAELPQFEGIELAPSKKGRYGGTFCHPKLAVFFARYPEGCGDLSRCV